MENLFGKITASLIDNDLSFPSELVDIINVNISPPEKVTAENIYIRAMYIVSDEVNSYGGRFPENEFETVMNLIVDSPVLVGHRKDSLPIARNFHAEQIRRGATNWIKVYFYWLKNAKGAETLKNNIDGGIYKECSISFVFSLPECSICGDDIRRCRHRPFKEYQTNNGEKSPAYFNYRKIDKVLETSIVYRGSVHDTSLTNELFFPNNNISEAKNSFEKSKPQIINRIWATAKLDPTHQYNIKPAYESIRIILNNSNNERVANYCDGAIINSEKLNKYLNKLSLPDGKYALDCRLVGYRGKERQKIFELSKYIEGQKSNVTRLELKVYDILNSENGPEKFSDLLIPLKIVSTDDLDETIKNLSTRYGVEITDCQNDKKYLLTKKKTVSLNIRSKKQLSVGYRYGLSGRVGENIMECTTDLLSKKNLQTGDAVEIEISSLKLSEEKLELISPKLIDSAVKNAKYEDIQLLIQEPSESMKNSTYTISWHKNIDVLLAIKKENIEENYLIKNFSLDQLVHKRRFLIAKTDIIIDNANNRFGTGEVLECDCTHTSDIYNLDGCLNGCYVIRPIVLNRTNQFLFFQIPSKNKSGACRV